MSAPTSRSRIRLLFDENLPWRVPAALQILELRASYVGDDRANPPSPARGSTDAIVLAHARRANQVIVSSNLDMVLLCVENQQSVIWIDPHGRQFRREELAVLVFKNHHVWARLLNSSDLPLCIRSLRTRTEALDLIRAEEVVLNRMRRIREVRRASRGSAVPGSLHGTRTQINDLA